MRPRVRLAEESRCMKQIENFSPRGMEVLVVDDDPLCLMVLERMLRQCDYNVTTCSRVSEAISMVRERKDRFDLVMSDVYMPNEDGFKLLEFIGLTLDLPVIMMSANGETSMVMKGITHGACDYLVKPVRMEELRNIWQHVVRRRGREYLREESGDSENETSKLVESSESSSKKRKDSQNLDHSSEIIDDISSLKKSRIHWTVQLHQQFVAAVNQLGIDKQKETVGQYTTLKPSVASVQPIRIVTPSDQEGSKEIASAMAERHAGDPTAYQGAGDFERPEDSESKEKDGAESEKGGFRNNLMSGLVVSGIVVAVLGALVAMARNMKMRT